MADTTLLAICLDTIFAIHSQQVIQSFEARIKPWTYMTNKNSSEKEKNP